MKCSTHEMCYLAWCVRLSTTVCDVRLESESDALLQSAVKISTTLRWLRRGRGTVAVGTAQRPRAEPGAGHDCSHQRGLLLWIQHSVSCCLYLVYMLCCSESLHLKNIIDLLTYINAAVYVDYVSWHDDPMQPTTQTFPLYRSKSNDHDDSLSR